LSTATKEKTTRHASQAQVSFVNDLKPAILVEGRSFINETGHPEANWSGLQSLIVGLDVMDPTRESQRQKETKEKDIP
jgi:hypothetical protein